VHGTGTNEADWRRWASNHPFPACDPSEWATRFERVWIVSPHPDDEVLALGATMATLVDGGARLQIVSVTDGEASVPCVHRLGTNRLARARRTELTEALARLGVATSVERLGLADGRIEFERHALLHALVDRVGPRDLILAPCRFDGPSDYESCGETMDLVGQLTGARIYEYPVWMWHWARPDERAVPWRRARRLPTSQERLARKRLAVAAFKTQLDVDGLGRAALPASVVERFLRPYETVFV
jgi:LmbE family N-acetylglucosaminyl deacetylase